MHLKDYISKKGIIFSPSVSSKKKALDILSDSLAEQSGLNKNKILDALLAREKLGSTSLGKGIAIPHCRIDALEDTYTAMLKLDEGVEFDASDEIAVTFLFCIVVSEDENETHLKLLSELAEILDSEHTRNAIQRCKDADNLYRILSENPKNIAA